MSRPGSCRNSPTAVHTKCSDIRLPGGHFGYNRQYDRFVTGLEADLSATDIRGATNTGTSGALSLSYDEKVHYLGKLRGRVGWFPLDNVLLRAGVSYKFTP